MDGTMTAQTYTLITGASGGIGLELAKIAAAEGRSLILVARTEATLFEIAGDLGNTHEVIACDLSQSGSATKLAHEIKSRGLVVSELINNAGFGDYGEFADSNLEKQLNMVQLNISSLIELTHILLPGIIDTQGKIMNIGSVGSFLPGPLMSVYFATKHFVLAFSEALSEELRGTGVTVTCLCPGPTNTSFGKNAAVSATHSTNNTKTTAESVARVGWRAMQTGKPVAINSFGLKVAVFVLTRLLPRSLVRRIVMQLQK